MGSPAVDEMQPKAKRPRLSDVFATGPNYQLLRRLKGDDQHLLDLLIKHKIISEEQKTTVEAEFSNDGSPRYITFTDAFEGKTLALMERLSVFYRLLEKLLNDGVISAIELLQILKGKPSRTKSVLSPSNSQSNGEDNQQQCQRLLEILEQADNDPDDQGKKFRAFVKALLDTDHTDIVKQLLSAPRKLNDFAAWKSDEDEPTKPIVPIVGVRHWQIKRGKSVRVETGSVAVWTHTNENDSPTTDANGDGAENDVEGGDGDGEATLPHQESFSINDDEDANVVSDGAPAVPATARVARLVNEDVDIKVDVAPTSNAFYKARMASSEVYPMNKRPRGIVVIINVMRTAPTPDGRKFDDRNGTEKDAQKLTELFTALHFNVIVYNDSDDLTARGILRKVTAIAKDDIGAGAQCVILFTLSHGALMFQEDLEVIFGTDGNFVTKQELVTILSDQNAPQLRGVPRIIFFQACRGVTWPYRRNEEAADSDMADGDVMVCYPTQKNYVSLRHRQNGSRYVQCLVEVFKNNAHNKHLVGLMKLVNENLMFNFTETAYLQLSTFETSLSKKLYFFPGIVS